VQLLTDVLRDRLPVPPFDVLAQLVDPLHQPLKRQQLRRIVAVERGAAVDP
jgi:hypothetical protein